MRKFYVKLISLAILSCNQMMAQESNHFKGETYEYGENHQKKSLPGVLIHIKEVSPFMSGKDGTFDVSLKGKNEQKKITIKSFGKYGYILSNPNPYDDYFDWWTSIEPRKLYFKKVEDVNKQAFEFNKETAKEYKQYHYELINGLYKRIEHLKSVSYIYGHQYLLASVNYIASPIEANDNTGEIDKIANDIVSYNDNLELNLNRIRLLSEEYARLIPMDTIDLTFLNRLEQMKKGFFYEVFCDVRQECLSDKENIGKNNRNADMPIWQEKRIFYNIRLLILGLSEDIQLVGSILELMHRKQNISYKYKYARFLFEYKSIEEGDSIISILENIDINNYSDYFASKVLKLLRDIYINLNETQKALKVNSKIMSLLIGSMNNDETAAIIFYEAQNFEYYYKANIKNILNMLPCINRLNESDAKNNLLITNLCNIINLYLDGRFESSFTRMMMGYINTIEPDLEPAKEYVNTLEDILNDNKVVLSDEKIRSILSHLYNYYNARENKDKSQEYKKKLLDCCFQLIKMNPYVDEHKARLLQVYVALKMYEEGEAFAMHIIFSNPFPYYTAFAYFELGCIKLVQEEYKEAKNYFKEAVAINSSLDKKYPSMKMYRKNIVAIGNLVKYLRDY